MFSLQSFILSGFMIRLRLCRMARFRSPSPTLAGVNNRPRAGVAVLICTVPGRRSFPLLRLWCSYSPARWGLQ
nr:MAG TPA: hypothetical protein [Inoviridae sp.]